MNSLVLHPDKQILSVFSTLYAIQFESHTYSTIISLTSWLGQATMQSYAVPFFYKYFLALGQFETHKYDYSYRIVSRLTIPSQN